ncbi:MAG: DUF4810 domain-containing protein [Nitrospirota bacterium]|nr:DUF4810 domain-containing protein [Nitrospirota bacterium]MDP2382227.1 DUF4810 domain-containing protein [Nitrospirota bacterium]
MMPRLVTVASLFACVLGVTACMPASQFYWGSYEDSLYSRQQHAGAGGETEAATMLLATINDAQTTNAKVGPGIHGDYGYLLFKQGRAEEAMAELQKEAALYPESKPLMDTMVSRIQGRKDKEKEKKPAP